MLKKLTFIWIILMPGLLQIISNPLADGQIIRIWPGTAPGSEGLALTEEVKERSKEPDKIKDRAVMKVLDPSMIVYLPEKPNGSAILVLPGGSYQRIVLDKEADELSPWLKSNGVAYFVLKYRLPVDGHKNKADAATIDAQRAMRVLRKNAAEWGIDPARIGIMGFSSGGHAASSLCVKFSRKLYIDVDDADKLSARPDFAILGYPVITMREPYLHRGSRLQLMGGKPSKKQIDAYSNELLVNKEVPQTFLMHAADDNSVSVQNSLLYYEALVKNGVSAELHIFAIGDHGYSIRFTKGKPVENWTLLCTEWLKSIKVIK